MSVQRESNSYRTPIISSPMSQRQWRQLEVKRDNSLGGRSLRHCGQTFGWQHERKTTVRGKIIDGERRRCQAHRHELENSLHVMFCAVAAGPASEPVDHPAAPKVPLGQPAASDFFHSRPVPACRAALACTFLRPLDAAAAAAAAAAVWPARPLWRRRCR